MGYVIFFLYEAFREKNKQYNKIRKNFLLLYDWMDLERTGGRVLGALLKERGYNEIIIYGWGYLGERLYRELESTQIKVVGILDRKSINNFYNITSYTMQNELPKVDAVINTVLYDEEKIKEEVGKMIKCPVINLEEFVR